jgi:tRNA pseudouridine55 synthase
MENRSGNSEMNGILNILKPPGMTSFDIVGYLRGLLHMKRIGHAGTLDPGAVGVLPVCTGSATKAIEFMMEKDKKYRAELTLGVSTDTQDASGQVLKTREVTVTHPQVREAIKAFTGRIRQVPPMYSAIKMEGVKLYELARKGVTVEREAREIEIYSLELLSMEKNRILMDVHCSKGTYIRTLCSDMGDWLGCGGHMSFLLRVQAGPFHIEDAWTVEQLGELQQSGRLQEAFLAVDSVFEAFTPVTLSLQKEKKLLNGVTVPLEESGYKPGQAIRVYNGQGRFIALGEVVLREGNLCLKSKKVF